MPLSSPSVTIITGFYKRENVVERTLQSLLNQTHQDIEIIVFDDASPDGTAQSIKDFVAQANDPRLVPIYHQKNIGFVAGLIDAVSKAKGRYIAIHGSGDVSFPQRIEKQKALLDARQEVCIVGSHYENVIELSGVRRLRTPNANTTTFEELVRENVFTHGEVMFRKSAYDTAGGYRPQFVFCQDYDLWLRMIQLGQFATVPDLLYRRYVDFEGVSYKPAKFIQQSRLAILARQLSRLSMEVQDQQLARVTLDNLADHVPLSNGSLQKTVLKAVLRAVVWGNNDLAKELADGFVTSRVWSFGLCGMIFLVKKMPFLYRLMICATGSSTIKEASR